MQGKVANLDGALKSSPVSSTLGIAHTRWATHGPPSDVNAHPHLSMHGEVAVVHNGVIDNFASLRQAMIAEGCVPGARGIDEHCSARYHPPFSRSATCSSARRTRSSLRILLRT